jgi:hypothetical protein
MGKVGRPKHKITHFIEVVYFLFLGSVVVLILYPAPLTILVVGLLWCIGEVASAFK